MNGDFEKLAKHDKYKKILFEYLKYRVYRQIKDDVLLDLINKVASGNMDTAGALNYISSIIPEQKDNAEYEYARINARLNDLRKYEPIIKNNVTKYVDIGCGNGVITAAFGEYFNLKKEDIIGVDIEQWAGHSHATEVSKNITFIPIKNEGELPIDDDVVDFVSANMVFHHIDDDILMKTMHEIRRCMKDGGLLFLREHDSPNKMIDSLINIEHGLFQVAIEKKNNAAEFQSTYFGKYKPMRDWNELMSLYGFNMVGDSIANTKGTRGFISMFRKVKDAKTINDMSVTSARQIARNMGIISAGSLTAAGVKRAIVSGRRKS